MDTDGKTMIFAVGEKGEPMSDDCISRKAAIDAVLRAEALVRAYGYRYAADAVRELPAVQPERKTGKWIDAVVAGELPVIVCDQCNTFFPLQFGASHNFCPNCGADMRGENDDIPNEYFESGGK